MGHRRELYIAVVSGEYRIPLKMHKCSTVQCSTDIYCEERDFGSFTCLRLCFYGFAFFESVHESDFCGGFEYPGFELCFLVLRARLHRLCFRGVDFRSCLLPLSPDFDLDWFG